MVRGKCLEVCLLTRLTCPQSFYHPEDILVDLTGLCDNQWICGINKKKGKKGRMEEDKIKGKRKIYELKFRP